MLDGLATNDKDITTVSGTTCTYTNGTFTTLTPTTVSGTDVQGTTGTFENAVVGADVEFAPGSPYNEGITFKGWSAEAVITGGMWVIGSKGVLKAAPASTQGPLGVAKATTASGATCEVLIAGPVYMKAGGNVAAGQTVKMGAGGALNCVEAAAAGSSHLGKVITSASSGGTALIWLGM